MNNQCLNCGTYIDEMVIFDDIEPIRDFCSEECQNEFIKDMEEEMKEEKKKCLEDRNRIDKRGKRER